jgi:hypothetical protein
LSFCSPSLRQIRCRSVNSCIPGYAGSIQSSAYGAISEATGIHRALATAAAWPLTARVGDVGLVSKYLVSYDLCEVLALLVLTASIKREPDGRHSLRALPKTQCGRFVLAVLG